MTTRSSSKMICPGCGAEMNQHAEKLVDPTSAEMAKRIDPALGAIVQEMHTCPGCGAGAMREAQP
jgi:ribosomal protein S27AE